MQHVSYFWSYFWFYWMVIGFFINLPLTVDRDEFGWPTLILLLTPTPWCLFYWAMMFLWPAILVAIKFSQSCRQEYLEMLRDMFRFSRYFPSEFEF